MIFFWVSLFSSAIGFYLGDKFCNSRWKNNAKTYLRLECDGRIYKVNYADGDLKDKCGHDIYCLVCGYYCLGKGGAFCIDKPSLCKGDSNET